MSSSRTICAVRRPASLMWDDAGRSAPDGVDCTRRVVERLRGVALPLAGSPILGAVVQLLLRGSARRMTSDHVFSFCSMIIAPSSERSLRMADVRTYEVRTFGCQMNVHALQRLSGSLESAGYVPAGAGEDADVIVINTCAVRENAAGKLYGTSDT